ncbi:chromate transporter [Mycoplasmopsis glycophila]|uniref:Chromate transporter n=1 Tax=Mycoplasmopsis glycophila TaxID=171285 RepID=A0A449AW53_9BACT|nr:chromate transporter [Mycoplasmopsis glycophila]VEU70852.1 Chromate transporter [Mycoplasmopsis glycophila]
MLIALCISLPFLILISLIVFGGGQVFMPLFSWLWNLLADNFGSQIDNNLINQVFTVSNSTPGVVSTKFAFLTGYLVANGAWWGYLAMFLTYFIFCMPAIFSMLIAMNYLNKFKTNTYFQNLIILFKPLIAGIMFSLAIQLLLSISIPQYYFNKSYQNYFGSVPLKNVSPGSLLDLFNTSSKIGLVRTYLLYIFLIIAAILSFILFKKKIKLIFVIVINISLAIILLEFLSKLIVKII